MKKNDPRSSEEGIEQDAKAKLSLENEILRLKLQAECGTEIRHTKKIPPEIEHLFLKNVLELESQLAKGKLISVFDFLERPVFKKSEDIGEGDIERELDKLIRVLADKGLTVDFGHLCNPRIRYGFITGELFRHQINDVRIPGMFLHFLYEEFYPDHESDIRKRTIEFLSNWFERTAGRFSWELSEMFILPDGMSLPKERIIEKFRLVFDSYVSFRDCRYLIEDIRFELRDDAGGLAHVYGCVSYEAILENGDITLIKDVFKLFFALENDCWRIFYFTFPGFKW